MSAFFGALADGKASLAIASLPLHLFLGGIPHWYTIYKAESNKVQGGWTNQNPRAFVARLNAKSASGKKLSELEELILRGQSAQQNAYEWWPMWAIAVVLGIVAKVPTEQMNRYTAIHLVCRILYTYFYLTTSTRRGSYIRTAIFQFSLYPAVALYFKAAVALGP